MKMVQVLKFMTKVQIRSGSEVEENSDQDVFQMPILKALINVNTCLLVLQSFYRVKTFY